MSFKDKYIPSRYISVLLGSMVVVVAMGTMVHLTLSSEPSSFFIIYGLQKLFSNESDANSLETLDRILMATKLVEEKIIDCEKHNDLNEISEKIRRKNVLIEISTDLDFLYSNLDQVKGGMLVRNKRKKCTEVLHGLAHRQDICTQRILG